jgi:hypothetical protein
MRMTSKAIYNAYLIGCKLAEINNANQLAEAMSNQDDREIDNLQEKVPDSTSLMTGDSQYKNGDSWGHKVELFMPSNMGVPSR